MRIDCIKVEGMPLITGVKQETRSLGIRDESLTILPGPQPDAYSMPISCWILSSEIPFVSGMTRITQISWPTQQTA
jgi:hypothetical protein